MQLEMRLAFWSKNRDVGDLFEESILGHGAASRIAPSKSSAFHWRWAA